MNRDRLYVLIVLLLTSGGGMVWLTGTEDEQGTYGRIESERRAVVDSGVTGSPPAETQVEATDTSRTVESMAADQGETYGAPWHE